MCLASLLKGVGREQAYAGGTSRGIGNDDAGGVRIDISDR